jgi:hypothetical protein
VVAPSGCATNPLVSACRPRSAAAPTGTGTASAGTAAGTSPVRAASSIAAARAPDIVRSGSSRTNNTSTNPTAITHAATRNTSVIEFENPSRIGRASRASIVCRNAESLSTLPPPPWVRAKNGALTGLSRTAGSATAAWNAGSVWAADVRLLVILPGSVENRIEKNTAVPSVPPSWRKKVELAVTTPMSRAGEAFCTASTSVCMQPPRPRLNMAM